MATHLHPHTLRRSTLGALHPMPTPKTHRFFTDTAIGRLITTGRRLSRPAKKQKWTVGACGLCSESSINRCILGDINHCISGQQVLHVHSGNRPGRLHYVSTLVTTWLRRGDRNTITIPGMSPLSPLSPPKFGNSLLSFPWSYIHLRNLYIKYY